MFFDTSIEEQFGYTSFFDMCCDSFFLIRCQQKNYQQKWSSHKKYHLTIQYIKINCKMFNVRPQTSKYFSLWLHIQFLFFGQWYIWFYSNLSCLLLFIRMLCVNDCMKSPRPDIAEALNTMILALLYVHIILAPNFYREPKLLT